MKEWFKHLLDPNGQVSAKRVMGIIGGINLYIHTWIDPITGEELKLHILLIGGLLGVGALVDIFNKKKGEGDEK